MNTNVKINRNYIAENQIAEVKKGANELAKILFKIEELPQEERIATQYYIKGMLQGIQMAGEAPKQIGA